MADDPQIGRTLAGHRIESILGEGGMGVVYRARHEQLGKVRALKLLPPQLAQDDDFRERFEREWRSAAAIEHPNIVEVLDAGEAGEHLYILMRLIEGPDLAGLVGNEGPLAPERTHRILEQIGDALDAAHDQGLVHRDVTPRNILVSSGDRAYLADFGVARTTATHGLTKTGFFVGNLDYAAPEQIEGKAIDGRADIYALGGVLYTCLTGRPPYECDSEVQLMYAQLQTPPPVPSAVRPDLPAELDAVVMKAMAKSRDERYESCGELTAALGAAISPILHDTAQATVAVEVPHHGPLPAGASIGGYRIEAQLGRGGMGVVYLAERPRLGSKVALKVLHGELADDERFRDRFVRESQMASALDHPNILPVYDAGEADGLFYIAMRFVDGPSLKGLLEEDAPLEFRRAISLLAQIASALDTAHEHGLIHRDVKPANILVAKGGASEFEEHAYLADFGVSKRLESQSGLTGTGQFIGTLSYAAPEQIEGKPVDHRADVYALACVLYETLTGSSPFPKETDVAVLWAHVTEPPPLLSDTRQDLAPALDGVIVKALAKSPGDRYESCHTLIDAVRAAVPASVISVSQPAAASTVVDEPPAATIVEKPAEELAVVGEAVVGETVRATETVLAVDTGTGKQVAPATATAAATLDGAAARVADPQATAELQSSSSFPAGDLPTAELQTAEAQTTGSARRKVIALVVGVLALAGVGAVLAVIFSGSSGSKTVPPSSASQTQPTPSAAPAALVAEDTAVGKAIAGRPFGVSTAVHLKRAPFALAAARVTCTARLGGKPLRGGIGSFADGRAACRWPLLPIDGAGTKLAGTIAVVHARSKVERRFATVVSQAPEKLVFVGRPVYRRPNPGETFTVSFRLQLVDDQGQMRTLPSRATAASCKARVGQAGFTPGTARVSASGVRCSWPVPPDAGGRRLVLLVAARSAGHTAQHKPVRARVAAGPVPTRPPSPVPNPPPSSPPAPPTTIPESP